MAKGHNDETVDKDTLLDRRALLKTTGAAVAGLAATGMSGTAAARTLDVSEGEDIAPYLENVGDGETVEIPKGTYSFSGARLSGDNWTVVGQGATFDVSGDETLQLSGRGWTFGGVRFDVSSGNVRALPQGEGWTLQNCAWDGSNSMGSPVVRPYVNSGGEATISACWFGDGMGTRVGESAVKANSDGNGNYSVEGDLFVEKSYFWQNACYAAASASPGQPGNVHFDSCYFEDAYLAAIRTGSLSGTCNITNCVITAPDESDVPETSSGVAATRGIWAYWGEVVVENTDIYTPGSTALLVSDSKDDAAITASNCEVVGGIDSSVNQSGIGSDPSRSPPSGCVTSPTEAAEGNATSGTGSGNDSAETRNLVIEGTGQTAHYRVTVDGTISEGGNTVESWDSIDGTTAEGWVTSIGSLTFLDGDAVVTVDGEAVDPDGSGSSGDGSSGDGSDSGSQEPTTHELVVSGTGTTTNYRFTVDGTLTPESATIEQWDSIDGTTAEGWVSSKGSVDRFTFTGSLTELAFLQGDATVTVDGSVVQPGSLGGSSGDGSGGSEPSSHTLVVEGTGRTTNYEFSVDGSLSGTGGTIETWDTVNGSSATGWVTSQGSTDEFEFTGSVTNFSFNQGNANVYVDGSQVSVDSL